MDENQKKAERQASDQAIGSKDEDLLDRAKFAQHLADFISEWSGDRSLTIALHGPWGSGKSSVKNMVLQALRSHWMTEQHGKELLKEPLLDFSPWRWVGQDQVTTAFFAELGVVIGRSQQTQEQEDKVAAKWKQYSAMLTLGSSISEAADTITSLLGVPTFSIFRGLATGLKKAGKIAKTGSEGAEGQAKRTQTLEELKQDISNDLKGLERPILIIMDDIDRLTSEELKLMFGLVKANADFPNLVFLLLFQRDTVAENIGKALNVSGSEYLKKIIQLEFDIPAANERQMRIALLNGISDALLEKEKAALDNARLNNFLNNYSEEYFQTLRDIYRFSTTLKFHTSLLRPKGALEVDPVDLVIMETLRLLQPNVYHAIRKAKGTLTVTPNQLELAKDEYPDSINKALEVVHDIIEASSDNVREQTEGMMEMIFPLAMHLTDDEEDMPEISPEKMRAQRRVCDGDSFDLYFYFAVPAGQVSRGDIQSLIQKAEKLDEFMSELEMHCTNFRLSLVAQELINHAAEVTPAHGINFLTGLFNIGDRIFSAEEAIHSIKTLSLLANVVNKFLEQLLSQEERFSVLREAVRQSSGFNLPSLVIRRELPDEVYEGLFTEEQIDELKGQVVEKARMLATADKLLQVSSLPSYLLRWSEWGDPEETKAWVNKLLQQPRGPMIYLQAFVNKRRNTKRINENIGRYTDLNQLRSMLNDLPKDEMSPGDETSVDAFNIALERGSLSLPERVLDLINE